MKRLSCAGAHALIPLYVDHDVQPAEALEIASHLASCPRCAEETERERRIVGALGAPPAPCAERDIAENVISRLRRIRKTLPAPRALKWSALGILAALIVLDGLRPGSPTRQGIQLLTRLGELSDIDSLATRVIGLLPHLGPSTTSLQGLLGSGTGASPAVDPLSIVATLLLGGALLIVLLSGLVLAGGLAARAFRNRLISLF